MNVLVTGLMITDLYRTPSETSTFARMKFAEDVEKGSWAISWAAGLKEHEWLLGRRGSGPRAAWALEEPCLDVWGSGLLGSLHGSGEVDRMQPVQNERQKCGGRGSQTSSRPARAARPRFAREGRLGQVAQRAHWSS